MPKYSLKDTILDAGLQVMFRTGYHGSSVRDIAAAAGAPQGSFTNHFKSKEQFTSEVLDRYFTYVKTLVAEALEDKTLSPGKRLMRYLEIITGKLEHARYERGCLIGDLSLEAPGSSELLRTQLDAIFHQWRTPFAESIREAQHSGEIIIPTDATELAEFLLASWQGAMLRMKVARNPEPLERFKAIIKTMLFGETL